MKSRLSKILFGWFAGLVCCHQVMAVSIYERAGNSLRTATNNQETILNRGNVNAEKFGLLHPNGHDFDAKVETQPLIVEKAAQGDDLVIITTMKNQVIGINARTNQRVYEKVLGPSINTIRPDGSQDMDLWRHTPDWGISATPIIDPATNTLYVAAWVQKNLGKDASGNERYDNARRDYKVFMLDPVTGDKKAEPVRIFGQSQEGNDCWFNDADAINGSGKQYAYPKLRAALALTANHGLVMAFAANGEHPDDQNKRNNPHGFVIAYDTRGLLKQSGFSREPAIFCTTAFDSWGAGIWHAGGAPVTEGDTIFIATSNGTSNNGDVDLSESMIKLIFQPGSSGGRPLLRKIDWYKAFLDERGGPCLWPDNSTEVSCGRVELPPRDPNGDFKTLAANDWDFGAAGPMMIPGSNIILQGTKDGIIYALDKNNLGHNDRFNSLIFQPPLVASYFSGDKQDQTEQSWLRVNELNRSIPCVEGEEGKWFMPCHRDGGPENGRMHHIHALALAQKDASRSVVYVWGENSNLKSYDFFTERGKRPEFRAEGDVLASRHIGAPGGMPGGLLMVSGKPSSVLGAPPTAVDFGSAIVWAVFAKCGDANKGFAEGELIAYDATTVSEGRKLKRLFSTGGEGCHGGLGLMSRMIPPVVANGKVYVMIYRVIGHDTVIGSQLKIYGLKS